MVKISIKEISSIKPGKYITKKILFTSDIDLASVKGSSIGFKVNKKDNYDAIFLAVPSADDNVENVPGFYIVDKPGKEGNQLTAYIRLIESPEEENIQNNVYNSLNINKLIEYVCMKYQISKKSLTGKRKLPYSTCIYKEPNTNNLLLHYIEGYQCPQHDIIFNDNCLNNKKAPTYKNSTKLLNPIIIDENPPPYTIEDNDLSFLNTPPPFPPELPEGLTTVMVGGKSKKRKTKSHNKRKTKSKTHKKSKKLTRKSKSKKQKNKKTKRK